MSAQRTIQARLLIDAEEVATLERLGAAMFPQLAKDAQLGAAIQYAFSLSVHAIRKIDAEEAPASAPQFVRSV